MNRTIMQHVKRAGVVLYCVALAAVGTESRAATWTGTSADWSNSGSWIGGVPNVMGTVANFDTAPIESISTTIAADPVTVGAINYGNSSNIGDFSWTITNTNGLTLNQDDAGSGNATITNSNTNTGAINYLFIDSGTLTLADSLRVVNSSASSADNGAIQIGSVLAGTGALALRSEQAIDPNMSLTQARGAVRLTAANTYVGTTAIEKGLVVFTNTTATASTVFGTDAANIITLGNAAAPTDDAALGFQASWSLATGGVNVIMSRPIVVGAGSGARTIAILPDLAANTYTVTYSGTVTLNGDLTLYNPDAATGPVTPVTTGTVAVQNMSGQITGTGGVKMTGGGIAFLNFPGSGGNSYSGNTVVESGFLVTNNAVPNGVGKGNVIVNSGATYSISANETINGLSGSGTIRPYSNARTLTVGDNDQSSLFSGNIGSSRIDNLAAQALAITKTGTGTLTLSGSNTYTGATVLNGGKLIVNGTHTGTITNGYTVNANATFGGKGTINRNVVVANNGTLAPGDVVVNDTVGTLTTGGLTLNDGAHAAFELNPSNTTLGTGVNDYADIVGALTVAGAPTIHIDIFNAIGGGNLSTNINRTWTLASYDSLAGGGTPTFNITGTVGGASLAIVPDDNVGNPTGPGTIQLTVNASVVGVPGDYNNNGTVDAADYVLWRKGGPLQNEVDNPGTINAADYDAWRARFGNISGTGTGGSLGESAAVPEPTTVGLCAALALTVFVIRPTRRIVVD